MQAADAAELLEPDQGHIGRALSGKEDPAWGFFNRLAAPEALAAEAAAMAMARGIADGPAFAHAMTKRMLALEWATSVEQAIEAEAVAQALCMTTQDFRAPDAERGQIVKAYVVLRDGAAEAGVALARALQEHVKAAVAPYKYPRAVAFVESLPRTPTGKLRRAVLRERAAAEAGL